MKFVTGDKVEVIGEPDDWKDSNMIDWKGLKGRVTQIGRRQNNILVEFDQPLFPEGEDHGDSRTEWWMEESLLEKATFKIDSRGNLI